MRRWLIAAALIVLLFIGSFIYRPALFGFYGFGETQCFFLYVATAPTATQARWANSQCHRMHSEPAKQSSTRQTDTLIVPTQSEMKNEGQSMDDLLSDALGMPVRHVFKIGNETWPDRPPLLDSPLASDAMRQAIRGATSESLNERNE